MKKATTSPSAPPGRERRITRGDAVELMIALQAQNPGATRAWRLRHHLTPEEMSRAFATDWVRVEREGAYGILMYRASYYGIESIWGAIRANLETREKRIKLMAKRKKSDRGDEDRGGGRQAPPQEGRLF